MEYYWLNHAHKVAIQQHSCVTVIAANAGQLSGIRRPFALEVALRNNRLTVVPGEKCQVRLVQTMLGFGQDQPFEANSFAPSMAHWPIRLQEMFAQPGCGDECYAGG